MKKLTLIALLLSFNANATGSTNCQTQYMGGSYNTNCYNYERQKVPQLQLGTGNLYRRAQPRYHYD